MTPHILVLNTGSSSVKFSVWAVAPDTRRILSLVQRGAVTDIGAHARFEVVDHTSKRLAADAGFASSAIITHALALQRILNWLDENVSGIELHAVGHRVVHGGDRYAQPVRVDAAVLADLRALIQLAPLHQPHSIAAIELLAEQRPQLVQVACFDTAFHQTQPPVARRFALPRALHDAGIKRYGFHGLSYEYLVRVLPDYLGVAADGRVIVAHLGNGASLCGLHRRRSVATTMGFTPLDGLMMGTRCGALDPGVVLHLQRERGTSLAQVEHLLYHESGLLGVSGISGDMSVLLKSHDPCAQEAVELYVYRIVREIGSLAAALGGMDALVFSGGIGENAAAIRARVCDALAWLGLHLDTARNAAGGPCISRTGSAVPAWVVATHEDEIIAQHVLHAA
ncbi:MAG: acetate/propionate family kinase [Gammaproteobacteria bacterium]|nr:acetate/propionate family kinase [Gammaproteobacteria bacterium]